MINPGISNSSAKKNAKTDFELTSKKQIEMLSICLMTSGTLTVIYSKINESQRYLFDFLVAVFVASFLVYIAIYAYRGFITSIKINRTIDYISRWNHPDYSTMRATIRNVLKELESNRSKTLVGYLKENSEEEQDIVTILNFLEEVSCLIRDEIIDKDTMEKFYRGIIIRVYKQLSRYIESSRDERDNPKLYEHLEWLSIEWKRNGI